jgi:Zn-dependent M28 family amino/carboxypeptidase
MNSGPRHPPSAGPTGLVAVVLAITTLPLVACRSDLPAAGAAPVAAAEPAVVVGGITEGEVADHVAFLASDRLAGRATPSPGLETAARYVAAEFAATGLEPAPGRELLQWYALTGGGAANRAPNAVGVLRGADPDLRDTFVVFTAHMDHVGIGAPDASGDSIYNGADDDASGTAALIEIAEAFAALPERPARSVAFVAVSGEELGLLGSQAFIADGGIAVDRIVADVNIDMIGRNSPDSVVAIGMAYSDLGARLARIVGIRPELGLAVADDPWPEERFFFRSDHYNFAAAGIPALFLFAGVHEDYHRPSDQAERIDARKIARIASAAFLLGLEVANDHEPPAWTAAGRSAVRPPSR